MKYTIAVAVLCAGTLLACGQSYVANLTPAQDGGGARQGIGSVNLTLAGTTLSLSGSYSGLSGNSTGAHIHGPGAPGVNAGIIYRLDNLGLVTLGNTSGTYSGSLTLADIGTYTLSQQMTDLNNGLWYLNVHSTTFAGGEIRGQIVLVPEPSSLGLLALGTSGLLAGLRLRRD